MAIECRRAKIEDEFKSGIWKRFSKIPPLRYIGADFYICNSGICDPSAQDAEDSDDNLPLVGSRNGKWWYATYHNVTAIVGAGVLGLPTAMVYLGW